MGIVTRFTLSALIVLGQFVLGANEPDCKEFILGESIGPQPAVSLAPVWTSQPTERAGTLILVNSRLYRMIDHAGFEGDPVTASSRNYVYRIPDEADPWRQELPLAVFDHLPARRPGQQDWLAGVSGGQLYLGAVSSRLQSRHGGSVGMSLQIATTSNDLFEEGIGDQHFELSPIPVPGILGDEQVVAVRWAPLVEQDSYGVPPAPSVTRPLEPIGIPPMPRVGSVDGTYGVEPLPGHVFANSASLALYVQTDTGRVFVLDVEPTTLAGKGDVPTITVRKTEELPTVDEHTAVEPLSGNYHLRVSASGATLWHHQDATGQHLDFPKGLKVSVLRAVPALASHQVPARLRLEDLHVWVAGTLNENPALFTWDTKAGWKEILGFGAKDRVLDLSVSWMPDRQSGSNKDESFSQNWRPGAGGITGRERVTVGIIRENSAGELGYAVLGVSIGRLFALPWKLFSAHPFVLDDAEQAARQARLHARRSIPSATSALNREQPPWPATWLRKLPALLNQVKGSNTSASFSHPVFYSLNPDTLMLAAMARNSIAAAVLYPAPAMQKWVAELRAQNLPFHVEWLALATSQRPRPDEGTELETLAFPELDSDEWRRVLQVLELAPAEALKYLAPTLDDEGRPNRTAGRRPGTPSGTSDFWSVAREDPGRFLATRFAIRSVLEAVAGMYGIDAEEFYNFLRVLFERGLGLPPSTEARLKEIAGAAGQVGTPATLADAIYYGVLVLDPVARQAFTLEDL